MVNAKTAENIDFIVKIRTTNGDLNSADPRPGFKNFILSIPDKNINIETDDKMAHYTTDQKQNRLLFPQSRINEIEVRFSSKNNLGIIEVPDYNLVLRFRSWYAEILIKRNHQYDIQGYCGNLDFDPTNELILPLSPEIYGSTGTKINKTFKKMP